jgi:putative ABC transport system permease protein
MLYGVEPTDPMTYLLASFVICGIAVLAAYVPARRAARLDPTIALRAE